MKHSAAKQKMDNLARTQLSLLDTDNRDPGQVMADLEKQRDLINRCLNLGEEIIVLIDKDADRLLEDIRASEAKGIDEITLAMGKRKGHLSEKFHREFSQIFGKAMREMNEENLKFLRDALFAMDDILELLPNKGKSGDPAG